MTLRPLRRTTWLAAAALLAATAIAWPPTAELPAPPPAPAADYADAIRRLDALRAAEPADQTPVCRQLRLVHGKRTPRAVAFLHGFTNCPAQFRRLAEAVFTNGANVFALPGPHQGRKDVLTEEQAQITAEEITRQVADTIDIAHGLGETVTVVGISGGANAIAWAAHQRPDLDHGILVAPIFGYRTVPAPIMPLAIGAALRLPNAYVWWDDETKDHPVGPPYAYPRFSSRAMAEVLSVGLAAERLAAREKPVARRLTMVTNAADPAADNGLTAAIVANWRAHGAVNVDEYVFPEHLHLIHDLVDRLQLGARVDVVYPVIEALVEGRAAPRW